MKITKDRIIFIIIILVLVAIVSSVTTYATSYLYNSSEVSYDNKTSNITSDNVQGAIDELYATATDYNTLSTKINNLEDNTYFEDFSSKVSFTDSPAHSSFIRIGKTIGSSMCYIYFQGSSKTHTASETILTLPTGYEPIVQTFSLFSLNAVPNGIVGLNVDGRVYISQLNTSISSNTRIYFEVFYVC